MEAIALEETRAMSIGLRPVGALGVSSCWPGSVMAVPANLTRPACSAGRWCVYFHPAARDTGAGERAPPRPLEARRERVGNGAAAGSSGASGNAVLGFDPCYTCYICYKTAP